MGNQDLTQRQLKFVLEYVKTGNSRKSALEAGYSPANADSQGSHLLRNPKVKAKIDELTNDMVERASVDHDFVIGNLVEIAQTKSESTANRIKALELLGKYMSMFNDKQTIEQNISVKDYSNMSEEELDRELKKIEAIDMETLYLEE